MNTGSEQRSFTAIARALHWVMAGMILAMLGIGAAMVASLGWYSTLVSIHRSLGLAVLVLVVVRFAYRLWNPPPPLPPSVSRAERIVATISEYTMYAVMFTLPLVGWAMLSAARYPIVVYGSLFLPDIVPHDLALHAILRKAHSGLAYAFGLLILAHVGAVLFHTLIVRDGLLRRMLSESRRDESNGLSA